MDDDTLRDLGVSIHAGFPNAGIGSHTKQLDLTRLIIKHPSATYLMRLGSDEWKELGICAGDIVVIDRAVEARDTDVVAWWDHDQFVMSHKPAVPLDSPTWGVVISVIHQMRKP